MFGHGFSHGLVRSPGGGAGPLPRNPDNYFDVVTWTGTGTSRTIPFSFDLTQSGGLVWVKNRSTGNHTLLNTEMPGVVQQTSAAIVDTATANSITSAGLVIPAADLNTATAVYVAYAFKQAPKFFDVVTWVGDGTSDRLIPHNLGVAPGLIMIKNRTAGAAGWLAWHKDLPLFSANTGIFVTGNPGGMNVPSTAAWATNGGDASNFRIHPTGTAATLQRSNESGSNFMALLFAHDDSTDSLIKCGNTHVTATGTFAADYGFDPQFLLSRGISQNNTAWVMKDDLRGWGVYFNAAENIAEVSSTLVGQSATGHTYTDMGAIADILWMSIRG